MPAILSHPKIGTGAVGYRLTRIPGAGVYFKVLRLVETAASQTMLFLSFSANVVTVSPSGCILGVVPEAVFIFFLSDRPIAAFASIEITGAECGWVTRKIDVGFLLWCGTGANQGNRDQ
jgi:hypothetical protein